MPFTTLYISPNLLPATHAQSVVLAPLFVWYELLFLLGYRPQLYADINARIQRNVAEYRAAQRPLLASGQ